jgi:hypothetical protein
MSYLSHALFYQRGDLHLLDKIEMKLLIYMQAFMLIIHHSILCTTFIITHTYASYRIAGESFGSGTRRAGESRSVGDPGTGGARDRGARRGTPGVRGPPAGFL